jgi:hypothetical protein
MPFQEMSKIGLIYTPKINFPKNNSQFFFPRKDKNIPPQKSGILQLETASKGTSNL